MSVIIKGVHAPTDCESCPYRGLVKCYPIYGGTIPQGCPVRELHEEHKENDDERRIG